MKAKIEIDMAGAAFDGDRLEELARILQRACSAVDCWDGDRPLPLRDSYGNSVGTLSIVGGSRRKRGKR